MISCKAVFISFFPGIQTITRRGNNATKKKKKKKLQIQEKNAKEVKAYLILWQGEEDCEHLREERRKFCSGVNGKEKSLALIIIKENRDNFGKEKFFFTHSLFLRFRPKVGENYIWAGPPFERKSNPSLPLDFLSSKTR